MNDRNKSVNEGEEEVLFRRSVKGYNMMEVDEYISAVRADMDALRQECEDMSRSLEAANAEIERYRKNEEAVKRLYAAAEGQAEKLMSDAEGRAERILRRASDRCSQMVAETESRLEKQKQLCNAAKEEMYAFRERLFGLYREHIEKINAFTGAVVVQEADQVTRDEIRAIETLMGELTLDSLMGEEGRGAAAFGGDIEAPSFTPTDVEDYDVSDEDADGEADGALSEKEDRKPTAKAEVISITDDQTEFEADETDGLLDLTDDELNSVNELLKYADEDEDEDISAYYNDEFSDEDYGDSDFIPAEYDRETAASAVSVGSDVNADDDSDEFYSEDDDEFYPSFDDDAVTGTVGSFGFDVSGNDRRAKDNKWKVRKTMSLTDEFDAVANDDDDE